MTPGGRRRRSGTIDLDDEPAHRARRWAADVAEAGATWAGLRGQVHDRVVDEVDEPEGAVGPGGRHVADGDRDRVPAFLPPKVFEHRPGQLDPVHLDAAPAERQADPPGPDRELERPTVPCERGEELDRGLDGGRLVHRLEGIVVGP